MQDHKKSRKGDKMTKKSVSAQNKQSKMQGALNYFLRYKYLYLLLLPCVIFFIIFHYVPMYGVIIAFKDFSFSKGILGSEWVGFENFEYLFGLSDFYTVFKNSIVLSAYNIILVFPVPIILAVLINEIKFKKLKRSIQTAIYLPHFISWAIIGGILVVFLSPSWGVVNQFLGDLGIDPIFFLGEEEYFKWVVVLSSIWKEAGWGTIIYLAAITGIDETLYEAASVDGAGKWKKLWHITLPGIKSTIVLTLILRLGRIMSNGFEQIFTLQNQQNLSVSEVFETYTYRVGVLGGRFSFGTTVGIFTSVIGLIFLIASNWAAKKMGEEGVW